MTKQIQKSVACFDRHDCHIELSDQAQLDFNKYCQLKE